MVVLLTARLFTEIGIILLLFEVGLETDVRKLLHTGTKSLEVAIEGFFIPFLLGFALCRYLFGMVHLFTPIFFVMVGLSLNLREVSWPSPFIWIFSTLILFAAVAGKMGGAFVMRESWPTKVAVGLAIVPRGEVGLIFTELGRTGNIFGPEVYAGLITVIALTTLLPPFAMKWLYGRYKTHFHEK